MIFSDAFYDLLFFGVMAVICIHLALGAFRWICRLAVEIAVWIQKQKRPREE